MASNPTSKLQPSSKPEVDAADTAKTATTQAPVMLEDDDEFEDFPVEGTRGVLEICMVKQGHVRKCRLIMGYIDWSQEDAEVPGSGAAHLWEESWDDDDENEEFSRQLK
jgi:26 proteasome complex subunit DSS1